MEAAFERHRADDESTPYPRREDDSERVAAEAQTVGGGHRRKRHGEHPGEQQAPADAADIHSDVLDRDRGNAPRSVRVPSRAPGISSLTLPELGEKATLLH